jgi:hypothetical protein
MLSVSSSRLSDEAALRYDTVSVWIQIHLVGRVGSVWFGLIWLGLAWLGLAWLGSIR